MIKLTIDPADVIEHPAGTKWMWQEKAQSEYQTSGKLSELIRSGAIQTKRFSFVGRKAWRTYLLLNQLEREMATHRISPDKFFDGPGNSDFIRDGSGQIFIWVDAINRQMLGIKIGHNTVRKAAKDGDILSHRLKPPGPGTKRLYLLKEGNSDKNLPAWLKSRSAKPDAPAWGNAEEMLSVHGVPASVLINHSNSCPKRRRRAPKPDSILGRLFQTRERKVVSGNRTVTESTWMFSEAQEWSEKRACIIKTHLTIRDAAQRLKLTGRDGKPPRQPWKIVYRWILAGEYSAVQIGGDSAGKHFMIPPAEFRRMERDVASRRDQTMLNEKGIFMHDGRKFILEKTAISITGKSSDALQSIAGSQRRQVTNDGFLTRSDGLKSSHGKTRLAYPVEAILSIEDLPPDARHQLKLEVRAPKSRRGRRGDHNAKVDAMDWKRANEIVDFKKKGKITKISLKEWHAQEVANFARKLPGSKSRASLKNIQKACVALRVAKHRMSL